MSRCPQCAAAVTAAATWCSLCYADLNAPVASPPEPGPPSPALPAEAAGNPPDHGGEQDPEPAPGPGRHARGRTPAAEPEVPAGTTMADFGELDADALDQELFALLREYHGTDPLTTWSSRFAEPKMRWLMAAGGAAALIAVLVVLATVFGSVL